MTRFLSHVYVLVFPTRSSSERGALPAAKICREVYPGAQETQNLTPRPLTTKHADSEPLSASQPGGGREASLSSVATCFHRQEIPVLLLLLLLLSLLSLSLSNPLPIPRLPQSVGLQTSRLQPRRSLNSTRLRAIAPHVDRNYEGPARVHTRVAVQRHIAPALSLP